MVWWSILHQQIHLETMDDHLYRFPVIRNIRSKHVPPAKIQFSGVHFKIQEKFRNSWFYTIK